MERERPDRLTVLCVCAADATSSPLEATRPRSLVLLTPARTKDGAGIVGIPWFRRVTTLAPSTEIPLHFHDERPLKFGNNVDVNERGETFDRPRTHTRALPIGAHHMHEEQSYAVAQEESFDNSTSTVFLFRSHMGAFLRTAA